MTTIDTYQEAEARHPDELRQIARDRRTTRERLRPYTDESLLAAVARHAACCNLVLDLAYRTRCAPPAELLVRDDQFAVLIVELERRKVCGYSDLFEPIPNLVRINSRVADELDSIMKLEGKP